MAGQALEGASQTCAYLSGGLSRLGLSVVSTPHRKTPRLHAQLAHTSRIPRLSFKCGGGARKSLRWFSFSLWSSIQGLAMDSLPSKQPGRFRREM